jgi:hypothetical protein
VSIVPFSNPPLSTGVLNHNKDLFFNGKGLTPGAVLRSSRIFGGKLSKQRNKVCYDWPISGLKGVEGARTEGSRLPRKSNINNGKTDRIAQKERRRL